MSRPLYQSVDDLRREKKVCQILEAGATLATEIAHVESPTAAFDAIAFRGGSVVAAIDIKCRSTHKNEYATYMLSSERIERLHRVSQETLGVTGLIVVAFTDAVCTITTGRFLAEGVLADGGRTDRRDPRDVEPVLHIPPDKMTYFAKYDMTGEWL